MSNPTPPWVHTTVDPASKPQFVTVTSGVTNPATTPQAEPTAEQVRIAQQSAAQLSPADVNGPSIIPTGARFPMPPPLRPEPKRGRYGRYLLPNPEAKSGTSDYTRATTMAKITDKGDGLSAWKVRKALEGVLTYPGILDRVSFTDADPNSREFKQELDEIAELAQDAAGASDGRRFGDSVHAWTEHMDATGLPLDQVPPEIRGYAAAYQRGLANAGLTPVPELVERIVRNDEAGTAGTFDRIYQLADGSLIVGDLKGLALDTPLATPNGWTTMGEVKPGDEVFGPDGKPTTVTAKSKNKRIGTFIVSFDDGSTITCDSEHIWWTDDGVIYTGQPTAKSVHQIRDTLYRNGQRVHRVPVAYPLHCDEADLPIDPYLLGVWLGDGTASEGSICKGNDLFDLLEKDGHVLGKPQKNHSPAVFTRTVFGLRKALRLAGILGNKHIPAVYLRASETQRIALLQGLMDTDGTWNTARKTAVFGTTDRALADAVKELLHSLGQRPHLAEVQAKGFGIEVTEYRVEFNPVDLSPFRLPRKAVKAEVTKPNVRSTRRLITSIEPGPDVETACIAVDNDTHVYLAGREMIPTHNTSSNVKYAWVSIAAQLAQYANADAMLSQDHESWEPMPNVRKDYAAIMSIPYDCAARGEPYCDVYFIDLVAGKAALDAATALYTIHTKARYIQKHVISDAGTPKPQRVAVPTFTPQQYASPAAGQTVDPQPVVASTQPVFAPVGQPNAPMFVTPPARVTADSISYRIVEATTPEQIIALHGEGAGAGVWSHEMDELVHACINTIVIHAAHDLAGNEAGQAALREQWKAFWGPTLESLLKSGTVS